MVSQGDLRGWGKGRAWAGGCDGKVSGPLTPEPGFFLPRSAAFHNFVKVTLTKSPKKRPSATKMLSVNLPAYFPSNSLVFSTQNPRAFHDFLEHCPTPSEFPLHVLPDTFRVP
jgi:hypothetical protein